MNPPSQIRSLFPILNNPANRHRAAGFTPFHTPGHKLGKGAPDGLRRLLGDACLQVDVAMHGPLIVEDEWSTVVIPPQDAMHVDGQGNLHVKVELGS